MVLNQNIDNFFNENEQLAFCPGVLVPGIAASDDKMFQLRTFSYSDTQRHRLGPNYLMLPVNAPKCPYHNNHHDGYMVRLHLLFSFLGPLLVVGATERTTHSSLRFPLPPGRTLGTATRRSTTSRPASTP